MPIALLGGTFDPVHKGHLAIAHEALSSPRFGLERVVFIPAHIPPHKQRQPLTPYADRFAMLELALKDHPRFELSGMEDPAHSGDQPNYSINTIRAFKAERGLSSADLFFIVGVDSFLQLHTWREPQAILQECRVIVAYRPGFHGQMNHDVLLQSCANQNIDLLETVSVDISSTQIREAVAQGKPLDEYVTPSVAAYIQRHSLYR